MLASKSRNIEGERRYLHKIGEGNLRNLGIRPFDKGLGAHVICDTNHAD